MSTVCRDRVCICLHSVTMGPVIAPFFTGRETEEQGRAGKAKWPAVRSCALDMLFQLPAQPASRPPTGAPYGECQGRAWAGCKQGVRSLPRTEQGKGCQVRRKRSRCLDKHGHVSTKQALEFKTLRDKGGWLARLAVGPRAPSLPCMFPRAHKAAAVSLSCHLQLHPCSRPMGVLPATPCFSEDGLSQAGARASPQCELPPAALSPQGKTGRGGGGAGCGTALKVSHGDKRHGPATTDTAE